MEIAALILATLALLVSAGSMTWQLAKHFSTHTVQLQPIESLVGQNVRGQPIGDEFEEFDLTPPVPLTAEERGHLNAKRGKPQ